MFVEKKEIGKSLLIDAENETNRIVELIRSEVKRFNKQGITLGLSGGLDSSVCAYLCVKALGRKKVYTYILPERDSGPQNIKDAELVAKELGLKPTHIDLTLILMQIGVYDLISKERANDRSLISKGIRWIARMSRQPSPFGVGISLLYGTDQDKKFKGINKILGRPLKVIQTFAVTKVRLRMIILYYHAMLNDSLLIGTTDKSEWQIGFYDKYGDGANDLALLRHLYKTQIRNLARHLGVNSAIINKPSSGDLAANLPNEEVVGLSYLQLDAILECIEINLSDSEIMRRAGVTQNQLNAVRKLMRIARLREEMPFHL